MLPIKRVILYKHGVGYFERSGKVKGSESITLSFRHGEINDVLKSFTFLDSGKGSVTSISYDASKPVEKRLEDVFFHLEQSKDNLTELVGQLQGAGVEVLTAEGSVVGTVLGTQTRTVLEGERQAVQTMVVLLEGGERVRAIPLDEVKWLRPTDAALAGELRFYLDTVFAATRKDAKGVTIYTKGAGEREVSCAYTVECPVWKTTYRLLVGAGGALTLQGWAIVDNVMDEDWRGVELSLVSGLPVSFRNDLYSPRYAVRPEVAVRTDAGVRPVEMEEAVEAEPEEAVRMELADMEEAPRRRQAMPMTSSLKAMGAAKMMMRAAPSRELAAAAQASFEARTVGRDVGEMFSYDVTEPVTVLRDQSALVPILQRPVSGRKVLVYNESARERNPMACIRLANDTGLTLEEGPATVFEGDAYVGETMLPFLKKGDERMLSYAVELGVRVATEDTSKGEPVTEVRFSGGVLEALSYLRRERTYTVTCPGTAAVALIIEHPKQEGFELVGETKPAEETEGFRRFELSLPAGKRSAKLTVTERRLERASVQVRRMREEDIRFYCSSSLISAAVAEELRAILGLCRGLAGLEAEVARLKAEREAIFTDQKRVKENLTALGTTAGEREVRQMYVAKLKEQEERLAAIDARFGAIDGERKALEDAITARSNGLGPLSAKGRPEARPRKG